MWRVHKSIRNKVHLNWNKIICKWLCIMVWGFRAVNSFQICSIGCSIGEFASLRATALYTHPHIYDLMQMTTSNVQFCMCNFWNKRVICYNMQIGAYDSNENYLKYIVRTSTVDGRLVVNRIRGASSKHTHTHNRSTANIFKTLSWQIIDIRIGSRVLAQISKSDTMRANVHCLFIASM